MERKLTLNRYETCERCQGSGARPDSAPETCPACRGTGQLRTTQNTFLGSFSAFCRRPARILPPPHCYSSSRRSCSSRCYGSCRGR